MQLKRTNNIAVRLCALLHTTKKQCVLDDDDGDGVVVEDDDMTAMTHLVLESSLWPLTKMHDFHSSLDSHACKIIANIVAAAARQDLFLK